jgi:tRNA(Ile)-lysidine synthase
MTRIEQKILNFIDGSGLLVPGDKILVALSGGPDSVFALYFLNKYKKRYGIELSAVHFNHGLRGKESDDDENFARELCATLDLPFISKKINVRKYAREKRLSIEEAARKLRYKNLDIFAHKLNCSKIVTAHNLSDNAETILINLFSGAGMQGLSGIPVRRGNIIRPLLGISKTEITGYLEKEKIGYRTDSSNLTDDFKRNFIRHRILPLVRAKLNPSVDEAMFRSSKNFESEMKFNNRAALYFVNRYCSEENGSLKINLTLADLFDGEIPGLILKMALQSEPGHQFGYDDYIKINSLILKQKGRRVQLSGDLFAFREENEIRIGRKKKNPDLELTLTINSAVKFGSRSIGIELSGKENVKFGDDKRIEYISGDGLAKEFTVRGWRNGDRFKPLGMKGYKKISDFLTDLKIPASGKKDILLLLNRNHIVWIIGLRIGEDFKLSPKTKTIYKLWTR